MIYHYTSTRMAKSQNTDNSKCWLGCGALGALIHCWWEHRTAQPPWKTVQQFLAKLNTLSPYDTAIVSWYLPKWFENLCPHKSCTWCLWKLFLEMLTWKQPTCSSVGVWKNKLWYIQTIEHSVLKRNEPKPQKTWRNVNACY